MPQVDVVYDYLRQNYAENEPIFLKEICIPNMKDVSIRQQLKKLTDDGRLRRFDSGIYYFPTKSKLFRSGAPLPFDKVINKKYLMDQAELCGYISGILFANRLGLTTQVPAVYEIYTNKATTEYRETRIVNLRVILHKPRVPVNDENAKILQFLDLLREIKDISEMEGSELADCVKQYMVSKGISFESMQPYLPYYPKKTYKNIIESGLTDVSSRG